MRYQVNYELCSIRPALPHQTVGVFDSFKEAQDELIEYWHNRRTDYAQMWENANAQLSKARTMEEYNGSLGTIKETPIMEQERA